MATKKRKKNSFNDSDQFYEHEHEILIQNSKLFTSLEIFSLFLHIITAILAIISIVGFVSIENKIIEQSLEIVTLFFILLIIVLLIFKSQIKHYWLKQLFGMYWGRNNIKSKIMLPKSIVGETKILIGNVNKWEEVEIDEKVIISWKRQWLIIKRLDMKIELFDQKFNFNIENVVINVKNQYITIQAELIRKGIDHNRVTTFIFKFDRKNRTAKWSGLLPNHPFYGEWIIQLDENDNNAH